MAGARDAAKARWEEPRGADQGSGQAEAVGASAGGEVDGKKGRIGYGVIGERTPPDDDAGRVGKVAARCSQFDGVPKIWPANGCQVYPFPHGPTIAARTCP